MQNQPPNGPAGRVEPSPRKKKGQISFAQNSFLNSFDLGSLEEANNKKVAEDVQFLYSQLQRVRDRSLRYVICLFLIINHFLQAKKEREAVLERCDTLETQLQTVHKHFKEVSIHSHSEYIVTVYTQEVSAPPSSALIVQLVLLLLFFISFFQASTRRQMEEDAFRSQLSSAKAHFDRRLVKLTIKAKDRYTHAYL